MTTNEFNLDGDLLGIKSLCRWLGISTVTFWRMRQRGEMPSGYQISAGKLAWRRSEIEEWLKVRRLPAIKTQLTVDK